jgi:hypothetical protein
MFTGLFTPPNTSWLTPQMAAAAKQMHLATIPVLSGITAVLSNVCATLAGYVNPEQT